MTKQVQRRRGTASQHTSFTGAEGEISVNTTNKSVHVHDGVTAGGVEAARADLANVSDASLNTALAGNTLSSLTITSADINGGTIDGTVIGGTTPAAVTATSLTATGTTTLAGASTTANITFGDNNKAIFGAGSDLQIYHDGANSIIRDAGVGDMRLWVNDFKIYDAAGTTALLTLFDTGATNLGYAGAFKLSTTSTGVDVTGTVTANGLTVGGTEAAFGGASGEYKIIIEGSAAPRQNYIGMTGYDSLVIAADEDNLGTASDIQFRVDAKQVAAFSAGGDISFYEDTGTTPKFFWDASAESLTVNSTLKVEGGTTNGFLQASGSSLQLGASTASNLIAYTNNAERMRITSTGSVGIGTSSPSSKLDVSGTTRVFSTSGASPLSYWWSGGGYRLAINMTDTASGVAVYNTVDGNAQTFQIAGTERLRITSTGSVGIGTSSPTQPLDVRSQAVVGNGTDGVKLTYSTGNSTGIIDTGFSSTGLEFRTGNSFAAKIDASGNLLVGKSAINATDVGIVASANGRLYATVNGDTSLFNRLTSDGDIVEFRKDNATVGSIGVAAGTVGYMVFNNAATDNVAALKGASGAILPSTITGADKDGTMNLGSSGARFENLYLSGGVYLGGTVAANKLDDYEEGTWTPTISSGTANFTDAYYVKVGNLVTLSVYCDQISDQTSTTTFEISGAPFAVGPNNDAIVGQTMIRYFNFGGSVAAFMTGAGKMRLYSINSGGNYQLGIHNDFNSTSASIRLMFNYFT